MQIITRATSMRSADLDPIEAFGEFARDIMAAQARGSAFRVDSDSDGTVTLTVEGQTVTYTTSRPVHFARKA